MVDQSLRASFMAIDVWRQLETNEASAEEDWKSIRFIEKALDEMGPWAKLIGRPLLQPLLLKMKEKRNS